jgi:hypothetical protein
MDDGENTNIEDVKHPCWNTQARCLRHYCQPAIRQIANLRYKRRPFPGSLAEWGASYVFFLTCASAVRA